MEPEPPRDRPLPVPGVERRPVPLRPAGPPRRRRQPRRPPADRLRQGRPCALRLGDLFSSEQPGGLDRLVEAYRRTGFYHSREGYRLGRAAAAPIPVNVSVSRIHTAPEPLGLVVARDITERVRAQEALSESEAALPRPRRDGRGHHLGGLREGRIGSLNPAFEAITGWPRDDWIGRPFAELIHPEDRRSRRDGSSAAPPAASVAAAVRAPRPVTGRGGSRLRGALGLPAGRRGPAERLGGSPAT